MKFFKRKESEPTFKTVGGDYKENRYRCLKMLGMTVFVIIVLVLIFWLIGVVLTPNCPSVDPMGSLDL